MKANLDHFDRRRDLAIYWFNKASDLRAGAGALWVCQDREFSDVIVSRLELGAGFSMGAAVPSVYRMLFGMALELAYKASLVALQLQVPHSHELVQLANLAGIPVREEQRPLLRILTAAIVWDGRYPIPKTPEQLTELSTLETAHLFTSKSAGALRVLTPNRALNWEGCNSLWEAAHSRFWELYA